MSFLFRPPTLLVGALFAVAFLACPSMAHAQAKGLKIHNGTNSPVEFGITQDPNRTPLTSIGLQPGQLRTAYVTPDREYFWYRYQGDNGWSRMFTVPFNTDPVYRWRFVDGSGLRVAGAPDIPMFPFP